MEIVLERACAGLPAIVERYARSISVAALLLTVVLSAIHFELQPTFRMSSQMPDRMRAELDTTAEFGPLSLAYPIEIIVRPPAGASHASPETRAILTEIVKALEAQPAIQKVWSVELLRRWLEQNGTKAETIEAFLRKMPPDMKRRFLRDDTGALLVTAYLPDLTANETLRVLTEIKRSLTDTFVRHPDFEIVFTGLATLSAEHSTRIIGQLNFGLFSAIVLVLLLMGLAFRSVAVPIYSLVPNFIPLVAAGTALAATGNGLDYASIIALTVAFGIAVDNAIHILSQLRREVSTGNATEPAMAAAIQRVGPVLSATTVVLVVGMAATLFSALPPTRTFGVLSMITLATALIADLVVLPAMILAWHSWRRSAARRG
jgi:predicted RND superfamily exporter protein